MTDTKAREIITSEQPVQIIKESVWMPEARQIAAQCWCDEETNHIVMIPELAESIARRIAAWMETGAQHARNEEYWRNETESLRSELAGKDARIIELENLVDTEAQKLLEEIHGDMPKQIQQLQSEVERLKWLPIETAPKDGKHFLAAEFGDGIGFGYYDGIKQPQMCVVHWFEDGFYASTYGSDQLEPFTHYTHWMSLPDAPINNPSDSKPLEQEGV